MPTFRSGHLTICMLIFTTTFLTTAWPSVVCMPDVLLAVVVALHRMVIVHVVGPVSVLIGAHGSLDAWLVRTVTIGHRVLTIEIRVVRWLDILLLEGSRHTLNRIGCVCPVLVGHIALSGEGWDLSGVRQRKLLNLWRLWVFFSAMDVKFLWSLSGLKVHLFN